MGTAHKPKSTRASRGRSVRSIPKTPRTPSGAPQATRLPGGRPARSDDSPPSGALQRIRHRLELIRSSVVVVAQALVEQNCELDGDAARVLRHHVTDALTDQMVQIGLLIRGGAS